MDAEAFLGVLFGRASQGSRVEIRPVPPGTSNFSDAHEPKLPDLKNSPTVYFGILLRDSQLNVYEATAVWCDIDPSDEMVKSLGWVEIDPENVFPRPTLGVRSGGPYKWHLYWVFSSPVSVEIVIRLSLLAALAFDGDLRVIEPKRVMRLPGSVNKKYGKGVRAEVSHYDEDAEYDPEDLEVQLVAAVVSTVWGPGQRHQIALGLGAVLGRAGWDADRAERCVRYVCNWNEDEEIGDRVTSVRGSIQRHDAGSPVTAGEFREALGWKYKRFLDALGITSRDGDILIDGDRVGNVSTLQRDLVNYIVGTGKWAMAEGQLVSWNGREWAKVNEESFDAAVFTEMTRMKVVRMGDEYEFNATAKLAKDVAGISRGVLAASPMEPPEPRLLPVLNGVVDLDSGILMPPRPYHRNRWTLPVEYDPSTKCPTWDKFLQEAAPEALDFLRQWMGYCLIPGNVYQRMLWLYGVTGTGKSTFLNAAGELFGTAAVAIQAQQLNQYTVAAIAPAMVALCSEMSNRMLRTAVLKSLVSGDVIEGRHPYGRPFMVRFMGKLIWGSNALPPVDQAEGLWRRIAVVEFMNKPKNDDPYLGQKIKGELSGILNFAISGMKEVMAFSDQGVNWELPDSVKAVVNEYKESADFFSGFVRDELIIDKSATVSFKDMYSRYSSWAREHGLTPESQGPIFWRELKNHGLEQVPPRVVGGRLVQEWRGARLAPESWEAGSLPQVEEGGDDGPPNTFGGGD
jgi:P4 family phage/plasmid primase-like protien